MVSLYGLLLCSTVLTFSTAKPHRVQARVHRRNGLTVWAAGGPVESDIVNTPYAVRQEIATTLYAVTKCNHRWTEDLFYKGESREYGQEFTTPAPLVYVHDTDYIRRVVYPLMGNATQSPAVTNGGGPVWPILVQIGLDEQYAQSAGEALTTDLGPMLRILTGMPTSTWMQNQYTEELLNFALVRSNESPVVLKAASSATKLSPGSMYAIANPKSGPGGTAQLWSGPKTHGVQVILVNVTTAELLHDIESVSHITDFKRWTQGAWGNCWTATSGSISCDAQ